ncbi:MAG: hypothetical protein QXV63_02380, partial [Candidatus Aenigmatarchaeota archaeon]
MSINEKITVYSGNCTAKRYFDKYGNGYPELICEISKRDKVFSNNEEEIYRTFFSYWLSENYEGKVKPISVLAFEYIINQKDKTKYLEEYTLMIDPKYRVKKSELIVKNLDNILLNLKVNIPQEYAKYIYDDLKKLAENTILKFLYPRKYIIAYNLAFLESYIQNIKDILKVDLLKNRDKIPENVKLSLFE